MKIIDLSPKQEEETRFGKLVTRVKNTMDFGSSWESDIQAQEVILTQLDKALSNKYFLLRNVQLEGLDDPIPLILVGPPGLYVMVGSALKGVYQAKAEAWSEMHNRTRSFAPARPNLIARTLLMSRAVETFLAHQGQHILQIQPVLLFTNPGIHVDTIRPAVRVVLVDGMERFISGLAQTRTFFTSEDIQKIINALTQPPVSPVPDDGGLRGEPPASERQNPAFGQVSAISDNISQNYVTLSDRFKLTRGQWIFLGIMTALEVIVLIAFIIYVLLTS